MNKKGEFKIQNMLFTILYIGLVLGVFGAIIVGVSHYYDTTGYEPSSLDAYNFNENITATLQDVYGEIDVVAVDSSWFDFFSGIWSKFLKPFQFIYRSFAYLITIGGLAVELFQLYDIFRQFFVSLIYTAIIVIVLIKFGLGRKK